MSNIHTTALVHAGAELGAQVSIGPYAVIEDKVQIGAGTVIGPHVNIHRYTTIGPHCRIHAHAVLGDWPQDIAFDPQTESYLRIGAHCLIREGVTIHRGTQPGTATVVGQHCYLMVNSHLAHNVKLGDYVILVNGALLAGYAEVGDRAFISGNCLVHQFCRIGQMAMLTGGSVYNKDVPPFCKTDEQANTVVGLNVVGLRRAGVSLAERQAIKKAFHLLYRSGLNVSQAVQRIKQECPPGLAQEFRAFIESSQRGICRGPRGSRPNAQTDAAD